MDKIIAKIQELLALYGMKIIGALAILIIGWLIAKAIRGLLANILKRSGLDAALAAFVTSMSYVAMMIVVIVAALAKLEVETASIIAAVGAAGLAVGLALQGSLANFAAGVLIIIFKPFRAGDYIEASGADGVVKRIEIFTTTLTSLDNKTIIIPNAKLTDGNIVNYSTQPHRRVDMKVGVSYGDDLNKTREVIMDVLTSDPRVLKDPPPAVAVCEMADSSVNLVVRPWVKTADYWPVYFDITQAVKQRLDAEGITIPFPQRDVHIYQTEAQ